MVGVWLGSVWDGFGVGLGRVWDGFGTGTGTGRAGQGRVHTQVHHPPYHPCTTPLPTWLPTPMPPLHTTGLATLLTPDHAQDGPARLTCSASGPICTVNLYSVSGTAQLAGSGCPAIQRFNRAKQQNRRVLERVLLVLTLLRSQPA